MRRVEHPAGFHPSDTQPVEQRSVANTCVKTKTNYEQDSFSLDSIDLPTFFRLGQLALSAVAVDHQC